MNGLRVEGVDSLWRVETDIEDVSSDVKMPTMREIQDRSKGDAVAKAIAIIQTLWFAIQAAHRVSQGLIVTELELTTLGHVVLNIFIYWCWWNKPLNLQFPVDVYREEDREGRPRRINRLEVESQRQTSRRKLPIRVRMGAYFGRNIINIGWGWKTVIMCICFASIGGMFGAIHCLAWNSTFPTPVELLLWRVSALVVTAFPGLGFAIYVVGENAFSKKERSLKAVAWFLAVVYCLGRVCLLALALAALRGLPESAYEVPSWTVYSPHIG